MSVYGKGNIKEIMMAREAACTRPTKHPKKKSPLIQTSKEYATSTTAHGIPYIVEDGRSFIERTFWAIIVLMAVALILYQTSNLYTDWQDNPVVTSLDTVALPIEEIEFPAVTICPQGSVNTIMGRVLFKQFKEYINKKQLSQNAHVPMNLTYDEMMKEAEHFLNDVYPGARDTPTKLIRLMTSNDPKKAIENEAVLQPADDLDCDPSDNLDIAITMNKQLNNDTCPKDFEMLTGNGCIHTAQYQMTYSEASDYCNQKAGARLLYFDTYQSLEAFKEYKLPGIILVA